MSNWIGTISPVLPDILAAAGLILLGIAFCRNRVRYREEEHRLQEAIRSLQGEAELTGSSELRDGTETQDETVVTGGTDLQDGADVRSNAQKRETGHSGKGDI